MVVVDAKLGVDLLELDRPGDGEGAPLIVDVGLGRVQDGLDEGPLVRLLAAGADAALHGNEGVRSLAVGDAVVTTSDRSGA